VHLMVKPVDALINAFAAAGANFITIHPEATEHLDRSLQLIQDKGCRAGLALNPATSLDCLDYTLDKLDLVLLMSVNPGFGGQTFIPSTLEKIRQTKKRLDDENSARKIYLAVDGGVKPDNIGLLAEAGADTFVMGSAIFGASDYNSDYSRVIAQARTHLMNENKA